MYVCDICSSTTTRKKHVPRLKFKHWLNFVKWTRSSDAGVTQQKSIRAKHTRQREREKRYHTNTYTPSHNWDSSRAVAATHMQRCPIKIEFFCNFHSYVCARYTTYTTNYTRSAYTIWLAVCFGINIVITDRCYYIFHLTTHAYICSSNVSFTHPILKYLHTHMHTSMHA